MENSENLQQIFNEKIESHLYHYYWNQLGLQDWKIRIENRKNEVSDNIMILKTIEHFISSFSGMDVLVVGSGWGGACNAVKKLGAHDVIGVDIDSDVNEIANLRMQLDGFDKCCFNAEGEHLPFKDNQFDYIHCVSVLEHVTNVKECINEMIRVTKPKGSILIHAPNYLRPIEKHYKIPFFPLMPKFLARLYLKSINRPSSFIQHINYIYPQKIKNILKGNPRIVYEDIALQYKKIMNGLKKGEEENNVQRIEKKGNNNSWVFNIIFFSILRNYDCIFKTVDIIYLIKKL